MFTIAVAAIGVRFRLYDFISTEEWDSRQNVPPSCLLALSFISDLSPLMLHSLKAKDCERGYATDACRRGGTGTYTHKAHDSERKLLRKTLVRKGWREELIGKKKLLTDVADDQAAAKIEIYEKNGQEIIENRKLQAFAAFEEYF